MKRKLSVLLIGLLAVEMASCGKKEEAVPEKFSTVTGVRVETVKASAVEDFYEAVGTVRSRTTSVLSPRVMGYILAVHVREGDRLKPGQLLIEIDNREASAQLKRAQAGVREAEQMLQESERTARAFESAKAATEADQALAASTFNRYQPLLERRSVSQQEFDEVQARYLAKTAEVERAKDMLQSVQAKKEQALARIEQAKAGVVQAQVLADYGRVYSPLRGVVASKQAEVGALAAPGTPLLTIEDDTRYRLEASVEETMLGRIRLGQPVRVAIDALGGQWLEAPVGEVQPAADPASRSSVVKIDLPENLGKKGSVRVLRSGLFGKARFPIDQTAVIAIPQKAVLQQGQLTQVFAVGPDNRAHLRLIKAGRAYGDRVEVLSGIDEGDRIIVEGVEKVKDGDRIA
jgi:multidrug efflux pump subunit AcrA (membrane-fusion protein)